MNVHPAEHTLHAYADGHLEGEELREVEEHLASCAECRRETEAIRSLVADLRTLPTRIPPGRDLLPGIRARIDAPGVGRGPYARTPSGEGGAGTAAGLEPGRRGGGMEWREALRTLRLPLAAAAVLLIVLSTLVTSVVRDGGSSPGDGADGVPVPVYRALEAEYAPAVEELQAVLTSRRDELSPETTRLVEESLRVIDRALAEARAALEREPDNLDLLLLTRSTYEKKVDLLRSAAEAARGS